jgi:hypothetical protein
MSVVDAGGRARMSVVDAGGRARMSVVDASDQAPMSVVDVRDDVRMPVASDNARHRQIRRDDTMSSTHAMRAERPCP